MRSEKYSQAMRLANAGSRGGAPFRCSRRRPQLDTGFAMAWRKLSVLNLNNGGSFALSSDAARRAYAASRSSSGAGETGVDRSVLRFRRSRPSQAHRGVSCHARRSIQTAESRRTTSRFSCLRQGQYQEAESLTVACMNRGSSQTAHTTRSALSCFKGTRPPRKQRLRAGDEILRTIRRCSGADSQSPAGVEIIPRPRDSRERSARLRRAANTFKLPSTRISELWQV